MCGIALIISGIKIDLSFLIPDYSCPSAQSQNSVIFICNFLLFIGNCFNLHVYYCSVINFFYHRFFLVKLQPLVSEDGIKAALQRRGPDSLGSKLINLYSEVSYDKGKDFILQSVVQKDEAVENGRGSELHGELRFIGATLQLRGVNPVVQPLTDAFANVLVYNGIAII